MEIPARSRARGLVLIQMLEVGLVLGGNADGVSGRAVAKRRHRTPTEAECPQVPGAPGQVSPVPERDAGRRLCPEWSFMGGGMGQVPDDGAPG